MGSIRGIRKRKRAESKDDGGDDVTETPLHSSQQPSEEEDDDDHDWWHLFSQRISGPLSQTEDLLKFESVFDISRNTFDYISSLVEEDMLARSSSFVDHSGRRLSVNDQVAVALRRLGSGESLSTIGDSFGMNQATVNKITWQFVESLEERGLHHLSWPKTETEMEEIKSKFEKLRGLPNCCGAIDITHIRMTLPSTDPSNKVWLDRENNSSMLLQAIVDPDMRFRDIVCGWPGSLNDVDVLRSSAFYKCAEEGNRLSGNEKALPDGTAVREYIVGGTGFPLLHWLLTPFRGRKLSRGQDEFNKRHAATRSVANRALVRLKEMWKIIQGPLWKPDKHKLPRIVFVCCILHNIVIDKEGDGALRGIPSKSRHDSGYQDQTCPTADNAALTMRDNLCSYLSHKRRA